MRRSLAMGLLLVAIGLIALIQVAYVVRGITPSPGATTLASFAISLTLVVWVEADARGRRNVPCHDFGFLVGVFFPVSLLWYAFWSRGPRGCITLAVLLALMIVPALSMLLAWIVRSAVA